MRNAHGMQSIKHMCEKQRQATSGQQQTKSLLCWSRNCHKLLVGYYRTK